MMQLLSMEKTSINYTYRDGDVLFQLPRRTNPKKQSDMAEKRKRDDAGEQGGKASKNPKINSDPALCDSSDGEDVEQTGKYHYTMICSSNVNRSCAAHKKLKKLD